MLVDQTIGTQRRRSQRIPLSIPIMITSLEPSLLFSGLCNTMDVSFHGCQFFISCPFKHGTRLLLEQHGTRLLLEIPDMQHTTSARVVRSIPAIQGMQMMLWKVSVELNHPGNLWGVQSPPSDWVL